MPTIFVLLGMGGCGKSQLALEYCQQSENDKSYTVIFWIDAMSTTTIEQSLITIARELSKPCFDVADVEGNVRYTLTTISTWREPWLLVLIISTIHILLVIRASKIISHEAIRGQYSLLAEIEQQGA
jgi:hypothetical protein